MRRALLLLLPLMLLPASFATTFGFSRITLVREWNVTSDGEFEFTGALAVNDSNQRVLLITAEPASMEYSQDGNGTITLRYKGNGSILLKATAVVDVNYDTHITSDGWVRAGRLQSTPLVEPDVGITLQAQELVQEDSSLITIKELANWVHQNVKYDIAYWGQVKSAKDVFDERRGVCVEYTHLFISLARSLGFDTRYVSGYVMAEVWQPHAWAEVYLQGYGWLPVDPTFGQVGILDSSHLAVRRTPDQSAAYDLLISRDQDADISAADDVSAGFSAEDAKGVSVGIGLYEDTYVAEVTLSNKRQEYVFGAYSLVLPVGFGGEQSSVYLLRPQETQRLYHAINHSLIRDGLYYTIPVTVSFNDARASDTLTVTPTGVEGERPYEGGGGCLSLIIPAALTLCGAGLASRGR